MQCHGLRMRIRLAAGPGGGQDARAARAGYAPQAARSIRRTPDPVPTSSRSAGRRALKGSVAAGDLGDRHRVSVGFPGLVRNGRVRNIPALSRVAYDGETDPALEAAWRALAARDVSLQSDLRGALDRAIGDCDRCGHDMCPLVTSRPAVEYPEWPPHIAADRTPYDSESKLNATPPH